MHCLEDIYRDYQWDRKTVVTRTQSFPVTTLTIVKIAYK